MGIHPIHQIGNRSRLPMKDNSQPQSQAPAVVYNRQVSLAVDPGAASLTVEQVMGQIQLVQQILHAAMRDGEHYGRIPGCGDKPALLKPGAEKLCLTFRLAPTYDVEEKQGERGHREYRVQCALTSILNGAFVGQGVGCCSTMEGKYRFRKGAAEPTDKPVPRAYWDVRQEDPAKAQELIGGKGFSVKKVDGKGWMIARGGDTVEHDNPADHYNTVLKMAKKRALVDAVLTATAASDIFTQDLEDITANMAVYQQPAAPAPALAATGQDGDADALAGHSQRPGTSVDSEAHAPRGGSKPVAAETDCIDAEHEPVTAASDFRETRVHFGKNRGLMLSELTAQQRHWYETDWMPKKEVNGPTSVEDLALINALKAVRAVRNKESLGNLREQMAQTGITEDRLIKHLCSQAAGDEMRTVNNLEDLTSEQLRAVIKQYSRILDEMDSN